MIRERYRLGIALLFCSASAARERCGAEAKLLVSPRDVQSSAQHAGTESRGEVYLFDTEGLEVLSNQEIVLDKFLTLATRRRRSQG